MFKQVMVAGALVAGLVCGGYAEASYTEDLRAQYANQDVYAEYTIEEKDTFDKKHPYTDVSHYIYCRKGNDMYLRFAKVEDPSRDTSSSSPDLGKAGAYAAIMSFLAGTTNTAQEHDMEMIRDNKMYLVNTEKCTGIFNPLGADYTVGYYTTMENNIYAMDVMRDIVTSSPDRMLVEVANSSQETIDEQVYDCEEVVVQHLSTYGRPIGYKKTCKMYYLNGELKCFTMLKGVKDDDPYEDTGASFFGIKIKGPSDKRIAKVVQLTKTVDTFYFNLIDRCELTER